MKGRQGLVHSWRGEGVAEDSLFMVGRGIVEKCAWRGHLSLLLINHEILLEAKCLLCHWVRILKQHHRWIFLFHVFQNFSVRTYYFYLLEISNLKLLWSIR